MSSAEVVCCKWLPKITDELSIEANSMDPEQIVAVWSGTTLFAMKQTTFAVIGPLRVNSLFYQNNLSIYLAKIWYNILYHQFWWQEKVSQDNMVQFPFYLSDNNDYYSSLKLPGMLFFGW